MSHVGTTKFNAARVLSSSSYQSVAIVELLQTFQWKRVIVLYSADDYGNDALNIFRLKANDSGIQIIISVGIIPGELKDRGLSRAKVVASMEGLQEYDARIFVLLLESAKQAQSIIMIGAQANVLNAASTLIGTSAISIPALFSFEKSLSKDETTLLYDAFAGYLGVQNAFTDWMVNETGLNFLKKFRKQPSTVTMKGKEVCSQATDDDGNFKLWNISTSSGRECGGGNYSNYGYGDNPGYAAWAYDSAVSLMEGIIGYCKHNHRINGDFYVPDVISGQAVIAHMVANLSIPGVTGTLRFSEGDEKLGYYGFGDRTYNVRYRIVNFNPLKKIAAEFELNRVGTWLSEEGYRPCSDDPSLQTNVTGGCKTLSWGTEGNVPRSDRAAPIVQIMPYGLQGFLIALAVILFVCFVFMAAVLVKYRHSRLLKASQLSMLWLVLVSTLYACARIIVSSQSVTSRDIGIW